MPVEYSYVGQILGNLKKGKEKKLRFKVKLKAGPNVNGMARQLS